MSNNIPSDIRPPSDPALASCACSDVRPVIRQSTGDCGVEVPHVFDTTVMPPHPDKRCRCGKQTWKKAEQETLAQLRCPKCRAMLYNVHASDLAKGNGEVTCSNCGHVRVIKTFSTAKLLTSPSQVGGRGKRVICAASPPGDSQTTDDVTRHPNAVREPSRTHDTQQPKT
jgi:predicted Zn finger-like uncharacterized protein